MQKTRGDVLTFHSLGAGLLLLKKNIRIGALEYTRYELIFTQPMVIFLGAVHKRLPHKIAKN